MVKTSWINSGIENIISLREVKMKLRSFKKFIKNLKERLRMNYFELIIDMLLLFHFYFLYYIFFLGYKNSYLLLSFNKYGEAKIEFALITFFFIIFTYSFIKKVFKWREKQN